MWNLNSRTCMVDTYWSTWSYICPPSMLQYRSEIILFVTSWAIWWAAAEFSEHQARWPHGSPTGSSMKRVPIKWEPWNSFWFAWFYHHPFYLVCMKKGGGWGTESVWIVGHLRPFPPRYTGDQRPQARFMPWKAPNCTVEDTLSESVLSLSS